MKARTWGVGARRFSRRLAGCSLEHGSTMVEYSIMLALIALASIVVITTVGEDVRDQFRWLEHRIP